MITVLVVGDIRLYREGLSQSLAGRAGIRVVGTACGADQAMARLHALRPAIVLLDMAMPHSVALVRALAGPPPEALVVALALMERELDVVTCAEAGVSGFVGRDATVEELVATLESVARGELLCTPRVAAAMRQRLTALAAGRRVDVAAERLTLREHDILRLIERGCSNKEIGRTLGIEVATVKSHVHNILDKLRARSRGEAAAHARRAAVEGALGTLA